MCIRDRNDTVEVMNHPIMGKMRIVKLPARFEGQRLEPARPSPDHGEHTAEVLAEFGVEPAKLDRLMSEGVVS